VARDQAVAAADDPRERRELPGTRVQPRLVFEAEAQAERDGERVVQQLRHARHLRSARPGLAPDPGEPAQGAVADEHRDVRPGARPVHVVQPFREMPGARARAVLAERDRGHAHGEEVLERRCGERIAVRVQVDEAGGDDPPGGIDAPRRVRGQPGCGIAHEQDAPVRDADVGGTRLAAATVDHDAVLDQHVERAERLAGTRLGGRERGRERGGRQHARRVRPHQAGAGAPAASCQCRLANSV